MNKIDKYQIADTLDTIGTLLELKGENPFRTRAYHNAAQAIRNINEDIDQYIKNQTLTSIKGIGKDLADKITEIVLTGDSRQLKELKKQFPDGVLEMLRIPGLGPKKVKLLFDELHISTIEELKDACQKHILRDIKGLGPKTEENILAGIEQINKSAGKFLYNVAKRAADEIVSVIEKIDGVTKCEIAGSIRRRKEIIGDIDILVSAQPKEVEKVFDAFVQHSLIQKVIARGSTKASAVLKNNIQCDVRVIENKEFPFALQYFTGSKDHNVELRSRAKKYGWSLNEYGFTLIESSSSKKKIPKCNSEKDIYAALDLQYIPPELRENMGEIEEAEKGHIPVLIEYSDINGAFHCHTTYSDGALTPEELLKVAKSNSWKFIGISDHSKSAAYAGGMSIETAKEQIKHLRCLAKSNNDIKLFIGVECDILQDGTLDYPDSLLAQYDFVIVSIHSKFKMSEDEATLRICKALQHPFATILGHPTGRLLLEREGYPLDLKAVIDTASKHRKLIEINSHPMRLDLDWRWLRYAKEKGVLLCINPDAHNAEGLKDVEYGVGIARKGWLEPRNVINTWTNAQIESFLISLKKGE